MSTPQFTTIKVNMPVKLVSFIKEEADPFGFSVQDFIRMKMVQYFSKYNPIHLTVEEKEQLKKSQEDIKAGRVKTFKNIDEFDTYMDTL